MHKNTPCYEATQPLTRLFPRRSSADWSDETQRLSKLQRLAFRWQCAVELLAVNLVSHLPHPLGVSLRRLAYTLFFAPTSQGLHAQASYSRASQAFAEPTIASWKLVPSTINADPANAPRSLYENCLRSYLKRDYN